MAYKFRWMEYSELRQKKSLKWSRHPPDVIPMDIGELDCEVMDAIRGAIGDAVSKSDLGYGALARHSDLPRQIASEYGKFMGSSVAASDVILSGGVLFSISECVRILCREEVVGLIEPAYPGLRQAIEAAGRTCIAVRLGEKGCIPALSRDDFDIAIKHGVRTFVTSVPHCPTGVMIDAIDADWLSADLERYRCTLIVDAIYAHSVREVDSWQGVAVLWRRAPSMVIVAGPSKCWGLSSIRVGWLIFNQAGPRLEYEAGSRLILSPSSSLGVVAASVALSVGLNWVTQSANQIANNKEEASRNLVQRGFRLSRVSSVGTPYLWLSAGNVNLGNYPALALLRRAKVAVVSGGDYGSSWSQYIRINVGTNPTILDQALCRIENVLKGRKPFES